MDVSIRSAAVADAGTVARLIVEMNEFFGSQFRATTEYVSGFLQFPGAGVFLAEVDGDPAGLLTYTVLPNLFHAGSSGYVQELFVREGVRGQGVGGRLFDAALEHFRSRGCIEASVATGLENEPAQRLYRSRGFTEASLLLERHF